MNARPPGLPDPTGSRSGPRDWRALAAFIAIAVLVYGAAGGLTSVSVGGWYQTLAKPAFNPPDWLFAPVWAVLYVVMAVAAWRVWRRRLHSLRAVALGLFAVQLALNLGWSALFFALQAVGPALVEIAVLWLVIAATIAAFFRVDAMAGWLLVPYLAWVTFAVALNAAIWHLN